MGPYSHLPLVAVALCVLMTACGDAGSNRASSQNMYDLPAVQSYPAMDNDSYYTQPTGYSGCNNINDAPSCGGG